MKILVANRHLKGVGGSETFTYALAVELKRQGHTVEFFTLFRGITSEKIQKAGIPFLRSLNFDLILTGQKVMVAEIKNRRITGPVVQICHGCVTPGEQPHPRADAYIAISQEICDHLKTLGYDCTVVLNGVDCSRFKPQRKARKNPRTVLSLVQTQQANDVVCQAAGMLGLEVLRADKYVDKIWDVENFINQADMVVSLGRGCYESMACARPVIIFDKRLYQDAMADGYLDPKDFDALVYNNCSGRTRKLPMDAKALAEQMQCYNADDGALLRKIATTHLNIKINATKILDACQGVMEEYPYPGNIDVVYVLGKGSTWADNEIRYSIRSFQQHFTDLRNIVIVGQCPPWAVGVIHIPFEDNLNINKDARMIQKVRAACKDPRVSRRFVFCTDDTFLLKDCNFEDICGWHDGPILYDAETDLRLHNVKSDPSINKKPSHWFTYVYTTGRELQRRGMPDNNYDRAHCPQPVDKSEYIHITDTWDYINNHYTFSNIYNNSTAKFTGELIAGRNGKIYNPFTKPELMEYLSDKLVFNVNDSGLTPAMKDYFITLYPRESRFENFSIPISKRKAVENWFKDGCDYDRGFALVRLFAPKNKKLIRYFELKHNPVVALLKLKKTLRIWLH